MAITGTPTHIGKATKQRAVEVSKVKNNLVAKGVLLLENFNGGRTKFQNIVQREHAAADDAENLSDIDDSEVVGYLNNTKEMNYKKIIWERMNREFAKSDDKLEVKKRKRENEGKKDVHAKRSAKTTERVENKRTSSRINYDALQKLRDELKPVSGEEELGGFEPKACGNDDSVSEDVNEIDQENEYGEDDDSYRHNYDDSYYGDGTGYYDGEDFGTDY